MRIAFISYEHPPDSSNGGIATYVAQASAMLVRRGHEVEVFASSGSRNETVRHNDVVEHWIRERDRKDFGIVAGHRFAARHSESPFDVLEGPEYYADARKARELVPDIPLVVRMHTPSLVIGKLSYPSSSSTLLRHNFQNLKHLAIAASRRKRPRALSVDHLQYFHDLNEVESDHARCADMIAPPCRALVDYALRRWNAPHNTVKLTPYPYTPSPELLRIKPSAAGNRVGFVGRLERRKGVETFVAAMPLVCREIPEAHFRFVGASTVRRQSKESYDEWIRREARKHGAATEITGKLSLSEMPSAYAELDVCVFPSLWENFPNVCLEAMAAGRAIVASSAGGMSDMLDGGKFGKLVEPEDPTMLAREIIQLLKNPQERVRLGTSARQRVLDAYNENVIGELTEQVYHEAIRRAQSLRR